MAEFGRGAFKSWESTESQRVGRVMAGAFSSYGADRPSATKPVGTRRRSWPRGSLSRSPRGPLGLQETDATQDFQGGADIDFLMGMKIVSFLQREPT